MIRNGHKKWYLGTLAGAVLLLGAVGLYLDSRQPTTEIKSQAVTKSFESGKVVSGADRAPGPTTLATRSELKYESKPAETKLPKANLIGLSWDRHGVGESELEIRTHDGRRWSEWLELDADGDKRDTNSEAFNNAVLLTENARRAQYRFRLKSGGGTLAISNPKLVAIDATTGPNPARRSLVSRVFGGRASATSNPRIYSRSEWGIPKEANGTPRWTPRYWKLKRVMVHHTVSNATNTFSSSAANVRAIWDYHANSLGWGDIGYNYLVDQGGRIFQGRYYNKFYATSNKVEVEGGHTYAYNDRSIGVAALGNFQTGSPSGSLNENIAKIVGYKIAPYGLGATARYTDEIGRSQYRVGAHRNYTQTACPGNNLYAKMGAIRNRAQTYRNAYRAQYDWDYAFVTKSSHYVNLYPGGTAAFYIDLKNTGTRTWNNTGTPVVHLGTDRPKDRTSRFSAAWISRNRAATFNDQSGGGTDANVNTIQPGETARFSFTVTAPAGSGTWKEYFRPVADGGGGWFPRDLGINWSITVPPARKFSIMKTVYSQSQFSLERNAVMNAKVAIKNTGSMTWPATVNPVRLATTHPRDRTSAFRTMDGVDPWLSGNRASGIDGTVTDLAGSMTIDPDDKTIEPGETGLFTVYLTGRPAPGYYREFFSLVQDGGGWFPDPGYNMYLRVIP
ncbi:MAG: N-acetylmuramoyl-L-alanine amidase [bacterium]|nr:N-acetylmuramoyl-L-alanine amidase [bacterium]MDZ4248281.1 N-acetylmuramoyl-L-alanine amidase [Patescibacteria group bacterium]